MTRLQLTLLSFIALVCIPISAEAGDGRIEINQARAIAGGLSNGDNPGFPVQIRSGNYVLTSDLDVPAGVNGIESVGGTGDFSIDLNGFSIVGPVTCTGSPLGCSPGASGTAGIEISLPNATIHGGTIRGFEGDGVRLLGRNNRVFDLLVDQNAGTGIDAEGPAWIYGNVARLNLDDGIEAGFYSGCLVRDNLVESNGRSGIVVTNRCLVLDNVIRGTSPSTDPALATSAGLGVNATSYRGNVISGSITVSGSAIDAGQNLCNGATSCP